MPLIVRITCQRCHGRTFAAQLAESGSYLVLTCTACTEPLLFGVQEMSDFTNPLEIIAGGSRDYES
jgi:hypothetical protein